VCYTKDELIFSQRGMHDVNNQLVFKSNPGFVFHDSRGFEAGAVEELNKVKQFIIERSKMVNLSQQLHVIWWVIINLKFRPIHFLPPIGTASRWMTRGLSQQQSGVSLQSPVQGVVRSTLFGVRGNDRLKAIFCSASSRNIHQI